jgi:hypothetical protein
VSRQAGYRCRPPTVCRWWCLVSPFYALCRLSRLVRSSLVPPTVLPFNTRPIPLLLSVCVSCKRLFHLRQSQSLPSCVVSSTPAMVFPRRGLVPGRVAHVGFVLTLGRGCRLSAIEAHHCILASCTVPRQFESHQRVTISGSTSESVDQHSDYIMQDEC